MQEKIQAKNEVTEIQEAIVEIMMIRQDAIQAGFNTNEAYDIEQLVEQLKKAVSSNEYTEEELKKLAKKAVNTANEIRFSKQDYH